MRRIVPAVSWVLVGLSLPAPAALAQNSAESATIVVMDGSNSMNGRLPGDSAVKHVLVREALRRTLPRSAPGTRVGMAAFGHRRSSDCTDAAMVIAPAAEPKALLTELERFKPRGFSPVALALREAAAPLAAVQGRVGLLLVLDDLASCRTEDPCTTGTDLVARNPRLTISVVGLALNPAAAERMTCLATAGKGRFINVQDAREIDAAFETVLVASAGGVTPPAPVPAGRREAASPRPTVPAALLPAPDARGLVLSTRLSPDGPPLDRPVSWRVTGSGEAAAVVAELEHATAVLDLPPGSYRVEARIGDIRRTAAVEIAAERSTPLAIVWNAGLVHFTVRYAAGGPVAPDVAITAVPLAAGEVGLSATLIERMTETGIMLPAGSWRLAAELGAARVERTIVVKAGEASSVDLVLEAGVLALAAEPAGSGLRYSVSEDDPDSPEGRREVARSATSAPTFVLPAGAYNLVVRRSGVEMRDRVVIRAGEEIRRRIALGTARVRVASRLQGSSDRGLPVSTRVLRLDGAEREVARGVGAEAAFELGPGRYRIEARIGSQNAIARRDIEVRSDGEQRIVLDHQAGTVQLRLGGGAAGLRFGEVLWSILDAAGQPVLRSSQPEPLAVLAAGRYVTRLEARGSRFERTIEVKAGDAGQLEMGG